MTDADSSKPAPLPLRGKHAVVTGGSRGIGLAVAQALLQQGAKVTVVARDGAGLKHAVSMLSGFGEVHALQLDVTRPEAVPDAFQAALQHFGPIAILVNNAGQATTAPFMKTDVQLLESMISANLSSVLLCTQAALPGMIQLGWGRIVNVASTAGLTGYRYASAYCAAKHAVLGLTRALALELAKKGVTVNAVCPGYTETDLVHEAVARIVKQTGRTPDEARDELAAYNPQGRLIQPREVAHAVAWLCMPGSSSVNGQAIAIDGGELMN